MIPIQAYGPDGKLWTAIADGGWRNDVGARMTDREMEDHLRAEDDGCPKDDPDCLGRDGDCHDACERRP